MNISKNMSNIKRTNYPLEFKVSSAQLAVDSDQPIAQTARDLGVNSKTFHNWISKYSDSGQINQKNMSNKAACVEENKRLRKELALVKQERDLLKKAAAYFAKTSQ